MRFVLVLACPAEAQRRRVLVLDPVLVFMPKRDACHTQGRCRALQVNVRPCAIV
jgi:hypothetical protein